MERGRLVLYPGRAQIWTVSKPEHREDFLRAPWGTVPRWRQNACAGRVQLFCLFQVSAALDLLNLRACVPRPRNLQSLAKNSFLPTQTHSESHASFSWPGLSSLNVLVLPRLTPSLVSLPCLSGTEWQFLFKKQPTSMSVMALATFFFFLIF